MRRFILTLLGAGYVLLAGVCGAPAAAPVAPSATTRLEDAVTPTAAPTPASLPKVTAVPPTPAPVLRASGRAVYRRGDDLYIGTLDGSFERALTQGAAGCGAGCGGGSYFAGAATVGGASWLYYTKRLRMVEPRAYALAVGHYALMRQPLEGGGEQTFAEFDDFVHASFSNASVSPDGVHVVYSTVGGLRRYDLATHEDVGLAGNITDCTRLDSPGGICKIFYDPMWSPQGDWLLAEVSAMEGARPVLMHPLVPHIPAESPDVGGLWARWSPDGSRICMSESGYEGSGTVVFVRRGVPGGASWLFDRLDVIGNGGVLSCSWAADGGFAVSYRTASNEAHVAFFDADATRSENVQIAAYDGFGVDAWLPDGSGVIGGWSVGEERPRSWIVLRDGTARRLAVDADTVLAVLS